MGDLRRMKIWNSCCVVRGTALSGSVGPTEVENTVMVTFVGSEIRHSWTQGITSPYSSVCDFGQMCNISDAQFLHAVEITHWGVRGSVGSIK